MTLWCLGSLNCDHIYEVPHFPAPGETLAAQSYVRMAGGKGLNQSIAARRAGAEVHHIGAIGPDGIWLRERLAAEGVEVSAVAIVEAPTGHAIIHVTGDGENRITLFAGANRLVPLTALDPLRGAEAGDWLLVQNETNGQREAVDLARKSGLMVAYCAAPFDAEAAREMLPHADLLILNEVEMTQLSAAIGAGPEELGVKHVVVTAGASGCQLWSDGQRHSLPARAVSAIDSTGAGDVLTGYLLAGLDAGHPFLPALSRAMDAAALMVTRRGTADVIPYIDEIT